MGIGYRDNYRYNNSINMITAFVGGILNPIQDKGNGKTATMTFSLLLAKYPHAQFRINKKTGDVSIILNEASKVKIYTKFTLDLY